MKKKYYVVWKGRKTGIFDSWEECKKQIEHFSNAGYKSFPTIKEAEIAFLKYSGQAAEYHFFRKTDSVKSHGISKPVRNSIAVDAACSGNPGIMEYRGVYVKTGKEIFSKGPFKNGTNNIGEFLAIVDAIRYVKKNTLIIPIYSDSTVAILWVKNKKCKTWQKKEDNELLFSLIKSATDFLNTLTTEYPVIKWETESWGEIPADYGRK